MKLNKYIVVLLILMLTIIPSISAADNNVALREGETSKDGTTIEMNRGEVVFEASQLKATAYTEIDGVRFAPANTKQIGDSLVWETGEKQYFIFDNPTVSMAYQYSGKKLKETITLKEDKQLSFPVTLGSDSKLIQWDSGQWKIVSETSGNTMTGIIIEKPYGIDASGKRIEMEYTYVDGKLNLEYNRTITTYNVSEVIIPAEIGNISSVSTTQLVITPFYSEIAYPLVIDPTWVVVGDKEVCTDCVPGYTIIRWTTSGSTTWEVPAGVTRVRALVIAGGGGGGWGGGADGNVGGGGGAGGLREVASHVVSGTETIVVGAKGVGGFVATPPTKGGVSSMTSGGIASGETTTVGGGLAGSAFNLNTPGTGGSGGGGGGYTTTQAGAAGTAGEGNAGGNSVITGNCGGGGGGGNAGVGATGTAVVGGAGGDAGHSDITGTDTAYAGGGGAAALAATVAVGGGWNGIKVGGDSGSTASHPGVSAVANTGSGGGGAAYGAGGTGGNGSDGIIIIQYLTPVGSSVGITLSPSASPVTNIYNYATLTNASLNTFNPNPQNWTFGDEYTSQTRNSTLHWYSVAGNYTVNLSMTNTTAPFGFQNATAYFNQSSDVDINVKTWMHMNGAAGGTSFPGLMGIAWTPLSVTTETTIKKFGTASALFNADNDRLSTPSTTALNFGTGNLTIEQWVYPTASKNNVFIVSRTSDSVARTDGWGIYHSTASATSDGWRAFFGATQTGTFSLPLNTWSFLAVQRINGVVNVSVDGVQVAQVTAAGNYDTANPIAYGDPVVGGGTTDSARIYLDETRMSTSERWNSGGTSFSAPWAEYRGGLFPSVLDPNPGSTLRFKTNPSAAPPGNAYITNLTPRYRTAQIQYVNISNNISTTLVFNPANTIATGVTANTTTFSGVYITESIIDNQVGTIIINATRPGGFSTIGLTENRASFVDVRMVYWNYTEPTNPTIWGDDTIPNHQYFGSGFLGNSTYAIYFPLSNFIATNITFLDWQTFSNFTISNNAPLVSETNVLFATRNNNFTANRFDWDFGDGSIANTTNGLTSHVYTVPGTYTVSSRAYLWQNTSVTNTTTLFGAVTAQYNASYMNVDFACTPTAGLPGLFVNCNDLTVFGNATTTGRIYNWSFGDGSYSATALTSAHVYPYLGEYTVTLTVNNTANISLGNGQNTKLNYIIISSNQNQQNTWWTPHVVQLTVMNEYGSRLTNVQCNATFNQSSMPQNWIDELYGIQAGPQSDMVNKTLVLGGMTGGDGTVTFTMLGSLKYDIYLTSAEYGLNNYHVQAFPSDSMLNIYVNTPNIMPPTQRNNTYTSLGNTTKVYFVEPNISYGSMCIDYQDVSGLTTSITETWAFAYPNQSTIQQLIFMPGTTLTTNCVTLRNVRGVQTVWHYNASRTV